MRKWIMIFCMGLNLFPLFGQETQNMTLIGRNGMGPSNAVFVYGSYLYMGNGCYLEVIEIRGTRPYLVKRGKILLPDVVNDVYVDGVGGMAYVACDKAGLHIVEISNPSNPTLRGSVDTPGRALGVFVWENHAYVADGYGGFAVINVSNSQNPYVVSTYSLPNRYVRDVYVDLWFPSGEGQKLVAYVAADTAGLWVFDVTQPSSLSRIGALKLSGTAKSVFVLRNIAYLGVGGQGFTQVNISDPRNPVVYRTWNPEGRYDIADVYVRSSTAYLADALYGIRVLDITELPTEIAHLSTKGKAQRIALNAGNTAFVADGGGGLLMLDVFATTPTRLDSIAAGDMSKDIAIRGNTVYVAGGSSGLWILNRRGGTPNEVQVVGRIDSLRYCQAVALKGTLLFVANGKNGVKIFSINEKNPALLELLSSIPVPVEAYDVDFDGNRAIIAGGTGGVHIWNFNIPTNPTNLGTVSLGAMPAKRIKVDSGRHIAYVATGATVHVVDIDSKALISTCPGTTNSYAMDLSENGAMLYVADGVNGVLVYDVSNPASPRVIEGMGYNTSGIASDIRMKNTTAVVADGEGTVRILDMSRSPIEVGFAHTGGTSLSIDISSDTVAVADGEAGVNFYKTNFYGTLVADESSLHFGTIVIGKSRKLYLTLRNVGTRITQIRNVSSSSGRFVAGTSSTVSIYPGDVYEFPIVFYPNAVQEWSDMLIIESDAQNSPLQIPVSGKGISVVSLEAYTPDYFTFLLYHCDQIQSGNIVPDASSYGYLDGIATGVELLPAELSRFGQAYKFEANDAVQVKMDSILFLPSFEGFSVDFWFLLTQNQTGRKNLFRVTSGTRTVFEVAIDDLGKGRRGLVGLTMPSSGKTDSVQVKADTLHALALNTWYHAALTYGYGNRLALYQNGDLLASAEVAISVPQQMAVAMTIGNTGEENGFSGYLDEFRVSGIARDPWEFNVCTGRIQVSTTSLNFGNVLIPHSRSLFFTITNTGVGLLWVDSIKTTDPRFSVATSGFTLSPGSTRLLSATFTPTGTGAVSALLNIFSKDPNASLKSIALSGTGAVPGVVGPYTPDLYTVGIWHLDGKTGDTLAVDASDNHLNGFLLNPAGMSWNTSFYKYGSGSLYFAGTSGWVRIPYHEAIDFSTKPFTIETWFRYVSKPTEGDYDVLIRRGWGSTCQYEILYGDSLSGGRGIVARVFASDGKQYTLYGPSNAEILTGIWYNVALSWDRAMLRLFFNGIRVDSTSFTGNLRNSTADVALGGNYGTGHGFNGYLDEIRFSSVARQSWEFNVIGPRLSTWTEAVQFDQTLVGESAQKTIVFQNTGDQPLVISGIQWKNTAFSVVPLTTQIPIGGSDTLIVTFTPKAKGYILDTLKVLNNDPTKGSLQIPVSGIGEDYRAKEPYAVDDFTLALYHFEETSGTVITDATGKHNGQLYNNGTRPEGYFGKAVHLDGKTAYITVPHGDDLDFDYEKESFTVECFFRTDTISQALLCKGITSSTAKPNYGIFIDNTGRITVPGFGKGTSWVADNAWHHVALVYDHTQQRGSLYIDGSLEFYEPWRSSETGLGDKGSLVLGAKEVKVGSISNMTSLFEGDLDEVRISNRARKPWEFLFLRSGMEITLQGMPTVGIAQVVNITFSSDASEKTVTVFYRKAGETNYQSVSATTTDKIHYSATIPASAVTAEGLEFYVQKTSAGKTITQPVYDPIRKPICASVQFSALASSLTLPSKKYSMISVPGVLSKPSVKDVLQDELGKYDPYTWRFFAWKDTGYIEYSDTLALGDSAYFNFHPGKAFWIITEKDKTFGVGKGTSYSTANPFELNLNPQWNMVSSPFLFPVAWDDCSVSSDSVTTLYYYDGTGYRVDWPVMEPWKGYFIYNKKTKTAKVYVPPRKTSGVAKLSKRSVLANLSEGEWILRISAEGKGCTDLDNLVGVRYEASSTWDRFDLVEPPPIGEYIALAIEHSDWQEEKLYATDIRAPGEEGYVWHLRFESSLIQENITLRWSLTQSLPEGWVAYWVDEETGNTVDLLHTPTYVFQTGKKKPVAKRFSLLVGTPEFVEKESEVPLVPVAFSLAQNYPNPFNPTTTIEYSLPKNGQVILKVYNLLGQNVCTLVDEVQKKGFHTVIWDGKNAHGVPVPSGIYFCRLEFMDKVAVRKMVLAR